MDNKENLLSTRIYEQVKDTRDDLNELNRCFRAANEYAASSDDWVNFEVKDEK